MNLEIDGMGYFPDAPTERGVKYLHELAMAVKDGYECFIAFVIAMPRVAKVLPNRTMHPEFGDALDATVKAGVKILCLPCDVSPNEMSIQPHLKGIGDCACQKPVDWLFRITSSCFCF